MEEGKLQELLDRQEIHGLITAYARHVDLYDPDGVAALFAPDAVIDYGKGFPERVEGPKALARVLHNSLGGLVATSHHISNVDIWFDGPDDAHGICYLYAWHRFADGRPDFHLWAQYHDRFRRLPEVGWRFSFRSIQVAGAEGVDREFDMIGRAPSAASLPR